MSRSKSKWTKEENALLLYKVRTGENLEEIAFALDRSVKAVRAKLDRNKKEEKSLTVLRTEAEVSEIVKQDLGKGAYKILYDRLNEIEKVSGGFSKDELNFIKEKREMGYSDKAIAIVLKRKYSSVINKKDIE